MPHLADVRTSKQAFQLSTVTSFVRQIAAATVGKAKKEGGASWTVVSESMMNVVQESGALLPLVMEAENVVKSKCK